MKAAVVQAGCWLLIAVVIAIAAIYTLMGADMLGPAPRDLAFQFKSLGRDVIVFSVLCLAYQRLSGKTKSETSN